MHLLAGSELFLEWSREDNFDTFYGGSNTFLPPHGLLSLYVQKRWTKGELFFEWSRKDINNFDFFL